MTENGVPNMERIGHDDIEADNALEFAAITKIRHADLWELSRRLGGHSRAAEQCGVSLSTFCQWVALQRCFPSEPRNKHAEDRWKRTKQCLESLTGKSIDELFPQSLRNIVAVGELVTESERIISIPEQALVAYADSTASRMRLPSPEQSAEGDELREAIVRMLERLSSRERDILKLRYGLCGSPQYTLEEIGHIMRCTGARVRQIEMKAINKLKRKQEELVSFV